MNFGRCLHIVLVIGKYTDIFREDFFLVVGGSRGLRERIFPWLNLSWRNRISIEGGAGFSSVIQKCHEKLNKKQVF